jgi:competence protein ComGC
MGNVLAELTQTLRRYSAEKREVPASLDALVSAGYLSQLPQAPAGKSFAIERKDVRVVLK